MKLSNCSFRPHTHSPSSAGSQVYFVTFKPSNVGWFLFILHQLYCKKCHQWIMNGFAHITKSTWNGKTQSYIKRHTGKHLILLLLNLTLPSQFILKWADLIWAHSYFDLCSLFPLSRWSDPLFAVPSSKTYNLPSLQHGSMLPDTQTEPLAPQFVPTASFKGMLVVVTDTC